MASRGAGGRSRTTQYNARASNVKRKATIETNQAAVDRLIECLERAGDNSNKVFAIRKAIKAVAEASEAITSRKEAMKLKGVGEFYAKIIVPPSMEPVSAATVIASSRPMPSPKSKISRKRKAAGGDSKVIELDRPSAKVTAYRKAREASQKMVLPQGPWKVVLLVDGREPRHAHVQAKLQMSSVPCEVRHLPIGDMAWIAKSRDTEVLLGTIVERKDVDDLKQSIYGSRYVEQRLRLQQCGIAQVLMLVEGDVSKVDNCPPETLEYAKMETRVHKGFQVVQTENLEGTVVFLKAVHRRILQRTFPVAFGDTKSTSLPTFITPAERRKRKKKAKQSLHDLEFDTPPIPPLGQDRFITYNELKSKVEMDREQGSKRMSIVYGGMLKQIKSISDNKALAILQAYPSMDHLMRALASADEPQSLLKDIDTNTSAERQCKIGPQSAKEVFKVLTTGSSSDFIVPPEMLNVAAVKSELFSTKAPTKEKLAKKMKPFAPDEKPATIGSKRDSGSLGEQPVHCERKGKKTKQKKSASIQRGRTIIAQIATPFELPIDAAAAGSSFAALMVESPIQREDDAADEDLEEAKRASLAQLTGRSSIEPLTIDDFDADEIEQAVRASLSPEFNRPKGFSAKTTRPGKQPFPLSSPDSDFADVPLRERMHKRVTVPAAKRTIKSQGVARRQVTLSSDEESAASLKENSWIAKGSQLRKHETGAKKKPFVIELD